MSNEVLNPFALYRDDKGRPLAAGTLKILQPGTSSLGTAFSDSALTVPQTVDGYVLDNYGRVSGDLKWRGTRDVEVRDANDAFIRTDSDVVTLVDASNFAINVATVAAMIADTTLVLGDVVETQNYNADQLEGGARYLVVAGGTGTEDSYIFHDLDNALQAQLIDQEAHNNPYVAGAIGDGTADDTLPVQRLLTIGGDIEIANGTFAAAGLTLSADARIHGDGTILRFPFANSDLFTLTGADVVITFDGVTLDGNLVNQSAAQLIAMIDSAITASGATTISLVTFNNVTFQNGSEHDVNADGDDSGFRVVYSFTQCNFLGGEEGDGTTYVPSSILVTDGANCVVEDCYFALQATPTVGRAGVISGNTGSAPTNPGYLSVTACTFNLMGLEATAVADSRGAIHARDVNNLTINNNRVLGPVGAGVVFGAECDTVLVANNLIDTLSATVVAAAHGSLVVLTTTNAAPGNNWLIDNNEIIASAAVPISIDGSSAGVNATNLQVINNLIASPTAGEAILYGNLADLSINDNFINMGDLAATNAIECNAAVTGQVSVEGNQIVNAVASIALLDIISTTANYTVDGNTIDNVVDGVTLDGMADAIITNNHFNEVSGDIITVSNLDNCRIDGNSYTGAAPTQFASNAGSITSLVMGENFWANNETNIQEIAVTGTNATVGPVVAHFQICAVTGVTTVDTLTDPGIDGYLVVLQSDAVASLTFNDALGNLNLGAATRVLGDATDTLALVWDETNGAWNEVSFSDN